MSKVQSLNERMAKIMARCSKFSGWNLTWRIEKDVLQIFDPQDSSCRSWLTLALYFPSTWLLREVSGRMRHWHITDAEERVFAEVLGYVPRQRARQQLDTHRFF